MLVTVRGRRFILAERRALTLGSGLLMVCLEETGLLSALGNEVSVSGTQEVTVLGAEVTVLGGEVTVLGAGVTVLGTEVTVPRAGVTVLGTEVTVLDGEVTVLD